MSNPAYLAVEYPPIFVAETSTCQDFEQRDDSLEWSEEEVAAIRSVLHKLTSVRIMNFNDAEDLVQDTLLTMIAKSPGNELEKGPLVWGMGILRNKVGNYYRKTRRHMSYKGEMESWETAAETAADHSPESTVFLNELQEIVSMTLADFPSSQRRAMELLIAGFEPGEIVKLMHPEGYQNVINRLYRGRKRLAKELAKFGYGPGPRSLRSMKRCKGRKKMTAFNSITVA
ncbi:MAG TPA: RNA polymerase sigma factor [Acidobacteriota bacterium]|nr:RNA polymerase sigma factor [Acidobacteriota bacterium]